MSPRVCLEGFECIIKKKKEIVLKIELQVDFSGPVQMSNFSWAEPNSSNKCNTAAFLLSWRILQAA